MVYVNVFWGDSHRHLIDNGKEWLESKDEIYIQALTTIITDVYNQFNKHVDYVSKCDDKDIYHILITRTMVMKIHDTLNDMTEEMGMDESMLNDICYLYLNLSENVLTRIYDRGPCLC